MVEGSVSRRKRKGVFHVKHIAAVRYAGGIDYVRCTIVSPVLSPEDEKSPWRWIQEVLITTIGACYQNAYGSLPLWAPSRVMMYEGVKCAHGFVGLSPRQGLMWQVSGASSAYIAEYAPLWEKCTRLDMQITLWLDKDPDIVIEELYRWAVTDEKGYIGKKRRVVFITNKHGGNTVYIGSRQSECFLRIYNKFVESGDEYYSNAIRFELELKGQMSDFIWEEAIKSPSEDVIIEYLCVYLMRIGIDIGLPSSSLRKLPKRIVDPADVQRTMTWLKNQVEPSVTRLVAWGVPREELLKALGLL